MKSETLLRQIDATGPIEHRPDAWWAVWPGVDVRKMAQTMAAADARLATITGVIRADGLVHLIYHWDAGEGLINIEATPVDGRIPSITDIVPAADWSERETRDYFGTDFTGRASTPPLVLREGDPPGLFPRTVEMGHEANPATATRRSATEEGDAK